MFIFTAVSKSIYSSLPREVLTLGHLSRSRRTLLLLIPGFRPGVSTDRRPSHPSMAIVLADGHPALPPVQCSRWAHVHLLPPVYTGWHGLTSVVVHRNSQPGTCIAYRGDRCHDLQHPTLLGSRSRCAVIMTASHIRS